MLALNMYFILLVDKRNPNWTKYSYLLKELLYRKNDYKIWIKGEPSWKQEFRNSEILAMSGVRCKYMDK